MSNPNDRLRNTPEPVRALDGKLVRVVPDPVRRVVTLTVDSGQGEAKPVAQFDTTGATILASSLLSGIWGMLDGDPDNPDSN